MLTGPIQPLPQTRHLDRSNETYALWEQNLKPNVVELPWPKAASFNATSVVSLMANAKTVMLGGSRVVLYEHVLAALRPGMRVYGYGAQAMEGNQALGQSITKAKNQVLMRLGYDLPANWIVVDGGRTGVLLVGSPGEDPQWAIPLERAQARSLFEAFRVLFWFHARREGLPDAAGNFAYRPPLQAPYRDPGPDIALPAGRLVLNGPLPDSVPDAEFRIVPNGVNPGRTATLVMPPDRGKFTRVRDLAQEGVRVVWTDMGLPRTTITRQRLVMDLIAAPIGIQLEWDAGTAVDAYHRIHKACETPKLVFHGQRRLRDIAGPVLLDGASSAMSVAEKEPIDLPDVVSALATFESAEPKDFPKPSPLSRMVVYSWRTVPEVVPAGAGKAKIVKQWTALDEWASRSVEILRRRLETMEREEPSFLDRLKRLLSGQTAVHQERARIRNALTELGEQPPSQRLDAADVVRRLVAEAGKIRGLLQRAHDDRQKAEDDVEEEQQRAAWQTDVNRAKGDLADKRKTLADLENKVPSAEVAFKEAEAAHQRRIADLRAARLTPLNEEREQAVSELATVKTNLEALGEKASKEERKPFTAKITRLEQQLATTKRDIQALDKWSPPAAEIEETSNRLEKAREARNALRKTRSSLTSEIDSLERLASEPFVPRQTPRLPAVSLPDIAVAPLIPAEAPPELGELFELHDERFLAVRTWEQVARANRVASRLGAKLVAFPDSIK